MSGMTTQTSEKYDTFLPYLKTEATRKTYVQLLETFKREAKIKGDLRKVKPKDLQERLTAHIISMKNRGKSFSMINSTVSAVQKYFLVHDIDGINFKKI